MAITHARYCLATNDNHPRIPKEKNKTYAVTVSTLHQYLKINSKTAFFIPMTSKWDEHFRSLFAVNMATGCTNLWEFRDPHILYNLLIYTAESSS